MSKRVSVVDVSPVGTKRAFDSSGFLVVSDCNVARTGIQKYRAFELGLTAADGWNPQAIVTLYRSPEEVFAERALQSYHGKPLTIDHKTITASNWKKEAVGDVESPVQVGDFVQTRLIVKDGKAIKTVEAGKAQLSAGYDFLLDLTSGVTPQGEAYDGAMRDIQINHVAIVDRARCGSACRVSDHSTGGKKMARKIAVDGIPFEIEDEALAASVEKLQTSNAALQKKVDDTAAAIAAQPQVIADAVKKVTDAKDAEIAELRKDVMTPEARDAMVADWADMLTKAKVMDSAVETTGKTCHAIRVAVLTKVAGNDAIKPTLDAILAGRTIEALDENTVRTAFNVAASLHKPADKKVAPTGGPNPVGDALLKGKQTTGDAADEDGGPEAYERRMNDLWKPAA